MAEPKETAESWVVHLWTFNAVYNFLLLDISIVMFGIFFVVFGEHILSTSCKGLVGGPSNFEKITWNRNIIDSWINIIKIFGNIFQYAQHVFVNRPLIAVNRYSLNIPTELLIIFLTFLDCSWVGGLVVIFRPSLYRALTDQAGLELRDPPTSASLSAGIKDCSWF